MAHVCCSYPEKGKFNSLQDAVVYLAKRNDLHIYLPEIVYYNIEHRDMLRKMGIEAYVEYLKNKCPLFATDTRAIDAMYQMWETEEQVANYDIQCYHIRDKVTVLGHTFNGLKDIKSHCSIIGHYHYAEAIISKVKREPLDGLYVGQLYDSYPILDHYDLGDDRTYQNYFFRNHLIKKSDLLTAMDRISCYFNFCMVHELIPEELLPILYYRGDGNYMLLATAKQQPQQ